MIRNISFFYFWNFYRVDCRQSIQYASYELTMWIIPPRFQVIQAFPGEQIEGVATLVHTGLRYCFVRGRNGILGNYVIHREGWKRGDEIK